METINDRMEMIVNVDFGGNKTAFATAIGIAPTSITNYIGKTRKSRPSSDLLEKIVNSLDIDAMWLLTGKGNMRPKQIDEERVGEMIGVQPNVSPPDNSTVMQLVDTIRKQAEEIGQLREQLARSGFNALNADSDTSAHAG